MWGALIANVLKEYGTLNNYEKQIEISYVKIHKNVKKCRQWQKSLWWKCFL